jgi:hypothetical protein
MSNSNWKPLFLYKHGKLVSWSQRRCFDCQRFLGKFQKKYCVKCGIKHNNISISVSKSRNPIFYKEISLIDTECRRYSYEVVKDFIGMPLSNNMLNSLGLGY